MNIKTATYLISSPSVEQCPKGDKPEYAFIGRSNVGKSSLINMICNIQNLAKTSGSPGKTQLINHFDVQSIDEKTHKVNSWYLVDLPGYGYAKVGKSQKSAFETIISSYCTKRENLICLFILIDSRLSLQKIDLEFKIKK